MFVKSAGNEFDSVGLSEDTSADCGVLAGAYGCVNSGNDTTNLEPNVIVTAALNASILPIALRYLPFFFLFYLVSGISIVINTNTRKLAGFRGYCRAIALNAGGIILYLIVHYGLLFLRGTALFPTQSLSSILLFGFVPVLVIAAIFTRALYKRDGNVWTAAFLNALLMTLVTVANTTVYFQR